MSILQDIVAALQPVGVPIETGAFTGTAPDEYVVIVPMTDSFEVFADDAPLFETQEARLSIYTKGNYQQLKNRIVLALISADFTITGRQYIEFEGETGFYHYSIDVEKHYKFKEAD